VAYTPDLVYDVGMHDGSDTAFYLARGFRVIAVEASPELCDRASVRFAEQLRSGLLTVVNAAIAPTEGPVTLYLNPYSLWNTTHLEWSERNKRLGHASTSTVTVEGMPFGALLERHGVPYYLKVDIEGADMLCVEALQTPDLPRYLSIESDKVSWDRLVGEFAALERLGYRRFKVVPQHDVWRQKAPDPPLEGYAMDRRCPIGPSGMFGKEAPGTWISADEALRRYRRIFAHYRMFGDNSWLASHVTSPFIWRRLGPPRWYDTHAALDEP